MSSDTVEKTDVVELRAALEQAVDLIKSQREALAELAYKKDCAKNSLQTMKLMWKYACKYGDVPSGINFSDPTCKPTPPDSPILFPYQIDRVYKLDPDGLEARLRALVGKAEDPDDTVDADHDEYPI